LFAVLLLMVPPCPAICKMGDTCPPRAVWSGRHWFMRYVARFTVAFHHVSKFLPNVFLMLEWWVFFFVCFPRRFVAVD